MEKRHVLAAFLMLILAVLACNRSTPAATPLAETPPTATPTVPGTPIVLNPTLSPTASNTPAGITPPATGAPSATSTSPTPSGTLPFCSYDSEFVTDVTVPDDTEMAPGTKFVKTWRMRNIGSCDWGPAVRWFFDSRHQMGGPDSVEAPPTRPDDTADISVQLSAPDALGTYTGYWRFHDPDGEAFGTPGFVRIVVTDTVGTVTPTASPSPTGTVEPGVGPVINYLRSDVDEADPGDTITLEWEVEGATSANLYHLLPTGQFGTFWRVEVKGSFDYEIDPLERNHTRFVLIASDDDGHTRQASVSVTLRCPDTWFFTPAPRECPASPAVDSNGAEQSLEHGTMIWIDELDQIYVLFDDGQSPQWKAYADEWDPGDPIDDPTIIPPPGFYEPVRGFGLVWRDQPGVRDRLGWAIDPEAGFPTHVQRTSRPRYNDIYIGGLGGVWRLLPESSGWERVP